MEALRGKQGKLLAVVFLLAAIAFGAVALVFDEDRLIYAMLALGNLGVAVAFFVQSSGSSPAGPGPGRGEGRDAD